MEPNLVNPTLKQLNQEHPEFTLVKDELLKMGQLYEGGHVLRKNCTNFLTRRPRELQEVYQSRVDRFSYHNILGTCFGWYRAAMFKTPPVVTFKTGAGGEIAKNVEEFYTGLRKDCDRCGTNLIDLLREVWTSLALYRKAFVLVDVPKASDAKTLRDQKVAGTVDATGKAAPYFSVYSPTSVINWGTDPYGNLDWVVIAVENSRRGFTQASQVVDTWYYFDRKEFRRYEYVRPQNDQKPDDNQRATLVDSGPHALSKVGKVPLLQFKVPDPLWLANRAYLPTIDHLNQDNSYAWSLFISNLAMPVITSDTDIKPTLSESGFIQLPLGAKYEWSEPAGRAFEHSARRVKELREEIYRAMYLTYQGKSSSATAEGASGASKEMDMMPAQEVMNEYGDVIIAAGQKLLDTAAQVRSEDVVSDVRGLNFGKSATLDDIQRTEAVIAIAIPSKTFEKEVYKQAAQGYLPDMNPEVAETICDEIDAAPSNEDKAKAEADQRQQMYQSTMTKAVSAFNKPPVPKPKPTATD